MLYSVSSRQAAKDLIGTVRLKLAEYGKDALMEDMQSIGVRINLFSYLAPKFHNTTKRYLLRSYSALKALHLINRTNHLTFVKRFPK